MYSRSLLIVLILSIIISLSILSGCQSPKQSSSMDELVLRTQAAATVIAGIVEQEMAKILATQSTDILITPTHSPSDSKPVDARNSPYIGGNGSPILPDGDLGKISIIKVGSYDGNILPVIVRNNTDESVLRINVNVVANAEDGSMLATGSDQGFNPNYVNPGEISLGYIYFGSNIELPDNSTYEFIATTESLNSDFAKLENIRDLEIVEQNLIDNRIVGRLKNSHEDTVNGPIDVDVYCFDETGSISGHHSDYSSIEAVNPGDTIPFQVELRGDQCPIYLVTSSGFININF